MLCNGIKFKQMVKVLQKITSKNGKVLNKLFFYITIAMFILCGTTTHIRGLNENINLIGKSVERHSLERISPQLAA